MYTLYYKPMHSKENIKKQAAALLGLTQLSVGKTNARKNFFPIVDSLNSSASAVEITDHDKPVAVLLSYEHYIALASKLCMLAKEAENTYSPSLVGSIKIKSSDLEAASERISKRFTDSIKNSEKSL
ncbi:MAG: type II toxin-antitoxin system Phd/YefM family antitoxin [Candidatus Melainabacteria bacterium]|nr:type II toxin-antitoxin system Phd/YefM family antitoxin [Candidatus Melainabacteria bacterium]